MKLYAKKLEIRLSYIMLVLLVLIAGVASYFFITGPNNKLNTLFGGMAAGFIVALIQFIFSWTESKEIDKFKKLKIKRILLNRDDREFYQNFIKSAKKKIVVMGVTASRFMEDFARDTDRPETGVLLDALNHNVKVQILVPDPEFFNKEDDKTKAKTAKDHFLRVGKKYDNFEYKYFKHVAAHSLVVVDDECLIGPCFPNIKSKDTPCIHISTNSPYAEKYLNYFKSEWDNAK